MNTGCIWSPDHQDVISLTEGEGNKAVITVAALGPEMCEVVRQEVQGSLTECYVV